MNLLDLPNIVLIEIFEHLSYEEVTKKRLVCGKIDRICQHILNGGFNKVVRQHGVIFKRIKALLPRRESERRNHCLARHADILTSIETRISMLSMTYTKYIDLNLCCFIPGRVLDEIIRILRLISKTVKPLRPHEVLQELRDISSMAIEHFDEKIATTLKRSYHMYSSSSRICNTTDTGKNKISTIFTDYLDNKTNMWFLKGSGSQSPPETLPNSSNDAVGDRVCLFQSTSQAAQTNFTDTESTESIAVTKKLQLQAKSLSAPALPYKLIDVNGNCRFIHINSEDVNTRQLGIVEEVQSPEQNSVVDAVKANESHRCPEARATMTYFKKLELEYKRGIVKMHRMQQIQTQQSRRLQQALTAVSELNVQVVELKKRLEDVDAKNREISANIKQINTGEPTTAVAEGVKVEVSAVEKVVANTVSALPAVAKNVLIKTSSDSDKIGATLATSANTNYCSAKTTKRSHTELEVETMNTSLSLVPPPTDDQTTVVAAKKSKI